MKKTLLFLCFLFSTEILISQNIILSEQAEISVLTIGPGTSLNDSFGHNAFRIKDPLFGLDVTYGYGEYDFDAPNFYLKFAQGKLNYLISKINFDRFYWAYSNLYNRTIKEQVLNLNQTEKQKLYDYLINNYKPENRRYLYDFFYDNCATKIKDVTNISVNKSINFNKPDNLEETSFRTLIQNNLNRNSWGSLGIDVALGSVIDRTATLDEHMFLPENIFKFFENATLKNNTPLVKESRILYSKRETIEPNSFLTSPLFILSIIGLIILFITYKDHKSNTRSKWLDVTLFGITGIIGILILLLWFATDHKGTHQNYNLLWAFAINLFIIDQTLKEKPKAWFIKYMKFLIILLSLLTLHWSIGVQVFAIGLIPFLVALAFRYLFLIKYYTNNQ